VVPHPTTLMRKRLDLTRRTTLDPVTRFDCSADLRWLAGASPREGWVGLWRRSDRSDASYELLWYTNAPLPLDCRVASATALPYAAYVVEPTRVAFVPLGDDTCQPRWLEVPSGVVAMTISGHRCILADRGGRLHLVEVTAEGLRHRQLDALPPGLEYELAGSQDSVLATAADGSARVFALPDLVLRAKVEFGPQRPIHPVIDSRGTPYVLRENSDESLDLIRLPDRFREASLADDGVRNFLGQADVARPAFLEVRSDPVRVALPGATWELRKETFVRTCSGRWLPDSAFFQYLDATGTGVYRALRWLDLSVGGPAIVHVDPKTGDVSVRQVPEKDGFGWLVSWRYQDDDPEGCHLLYVHTTYENRQAPMRQLAVASVGTDDGRFATIGSPVVHRVPRGGASPWEITALDAVWLGDHRLLSILTTLRQSPGRRVTYELKLWRLAHGLWKLEKAFSRSWCAVTAWRSSSGFPCRIPRLRRLITIALWWPTIVVCGC